MSYDDYTNGDVLRELSKESGILPQFGPAQAFTSVKNALTSAGGAVAMPKFGPAQVYTSTKNTLAAAGEAVAPAVNKAKFQVYRAAEFGTNNPVVKHFAQNPDDMGQVLDVGRQLGQMISPFLKLGASEKAPTAQQVARARIALVRASQGGEESVSNAVARAYAEELRKGGYDVDEIDLGGVPYADDWDDKYRKEHQERLRKAHATVYATPVYNWGPSARLSAYVQNTVKSGQDPYRPYGVLGAAGSSRSQGYLHSLQNTLAMEDRGINVGAPLVATEGDVVYRGDRVTGVGKAYRERLAEHAAVLGGLAKQRMASNVLGKTAALSEGEKRRYRNIALGAGAGLAGGVGAVLLRRPGLRAHINAKANALFSSGASARLAKENIGGPIPEAARKSARDLIRSLTSQGYSKKQIAQMKIGVTGTSGSGKSSVARALEEELGMSRISLDPYISKVRGGRLMEDAVDKQLQGLKPGTIVEQTQLLHATDPSKFDLLVRIERPVADIRKGLLGRGHAAFTADYVDFNKAQKTVNTAFSTAGGKELNISPSLSARLKPGGGAENRVALAQQMGLPVEKFKSLSQRDQIQSLAEGKVVSKSWGSHVSKGGLGGDLALTGALTAGGGLGGYALSRKGEGG